LRGRDSNLATFGL